MACEAVTYNFLSIKVGKSACIVKGRLKRENMRRLVVRLIGFLFRSGVDKSVGRTRERKPGRVNY